MKASTAWNELRRAAVQKGNDEIVEIMDFLIDQPEPEFVYRIGDRIGSKHRMHCILNAHPYWKHQYTVERTPVQWTDVTEDFVK